MRNPDPRPVSAMLPDELADAMAETLFRASLSDAVDLGDERSVDRCLAKAGYPLGHILACEDRAVAAARMRLQRRATIQDLGGKAADTLAFGALICIWTLCYCLLCPPARATASPAAVPEPLVSDITVAAFVPYAPLLMIVLIGLVWLWRDRGRSFAPVEDGDEDLFFRAPPTAPDAASLEHVARQGEGL